MTMELGSLSRVGSALSRVWHGKQLLSFKMVSTHLISLPISAE